MELRRVLRNSGDVVIIPNSVLVNNAVVRKRRLTDG